MQEPTPLVLTYKPGAARILLRCYSRLRPYWRTTTAAYTTLLAIDALTMLIPQLIRWGVDRGIDGRDVRFLGRAVLALVGLTLLKGVLAFFQQRWIEMCSQSVAYDSPAPCRTSSASAS
jgi:ABC-type multidrug transport system fused ATPase/permease subunit